MDVTHRAATFGYEGCTVGNVPHVRSHGSAAGKAWKLALALNDDAGISPCNTLAVQFTCRGGATKEVAAASCCCLKVYQLIRSHDTMSWLQARTKCCATAADWHR